jgi:hypothetical protein
VKKLLLSCFLLISITLAILFSFTVSLSQSDREYKFSSFTISDFFCPVLNSSTSLKPISFKLKSSAGMPIRIYFTLKLKSYDTGITTLGESNEVTATSTTSTISLPINGINNTTKFKLEIYYHDLFRSADGLVTSANINALSNDLQYNLKDSKEIKKDSVILCIKNGQFYVSGIYINFSSSRFERMHNLPYGKIPFEYLRYTYRCDAYDPIYTFYTLNGSEVLFGIETESTTSLQESLYMSRDEVGTYKTNSMMLYLLKQNYSSSTGLVSCEMLKSKYLREDLNLTLNTIYQNSKRINDLYIPYSSKEMCLKKSEIMCAFYFYLKPFNLYIRYYFPIKFIDINYNDGTYKTYVDGDFKENENNGEGYEITI